MNDERLAVLLFNLGGPDGPDAVEPFLRNLFSDPAILRLPALLRRPLAWFIARRRAPVAREIYRQLGGGSPILPNTIVQARALEVALADSLPGVAALRCFPVMRYWHPRATAVAREVATWGATRLALLPLYPQFSTTTTASSLAEWQRVTEQGELASLPSHSLCCYPLEPGFLAELAARIVPLLAAARAEGPCRLLLSAHGLPKKIVEAGDPYQWQVEQSAAGLAKLLEAELGEGLDIVVCYQSRVGPLEWIGPSTEAEVRRAGAEGLSLVVAPIAFVSEHSETLVELDRELAEVAQRSGVRSYRRAPTVDDGAAFIGGLARLLREALARGPGLAPDSGPLAAGATRFCPPAFAGCPCRE